MSLLRAEEFSMHSKKKEAEKNLRGVLKKRSSTSV
jgi:hypothetical protein